MMSSPSVNSKTSDKDLLLQEVAKKIICLNKSCVADAPVQDGDVSSSNPPVLATELFAPALEEMEAFLFVVDSQGKVVSVTDNISKYLGYQPSDWSDRSIYNFLNVANHAAFGKNLLSLVGDPKGEVGKFSKPSHFPCRMHQCPAGGGEKKRDVHVMISSRPYYLDNEHSRCSPGSKMYLICVAQRVKDPIALYSGSTHRVKRSTNLLLGGGNQTFQPNTVVFETTSTTDWMVISSDVSQLPVQTDYFVGKKFTDFICSQDIPRFQTHIDAVGSSSLSHSHSSSIYRLKLGSTQHVFVQTCSHLTSAESQSSLFILSKHSILKECSPAELKGSASTSFMKAVSSHQPQSSVSTGQQDLLDAAGHPVNSPPYSAKTSRLPAASPPPYHQHLQRTHRLPSGSLSTPSQHHNSTSFSSMTLMSGVPQLPDVNFNDCYPSPRLTYSSSSSNYELCDSGMGWSMTPPASGGSSGDKIRVHQMVSQSTRPALTTQHSSSSSMSMDVSAITSLLDSTTSHTGTFTSRASFDSTLQQLDNVNLSYSTTSDVSVNGSMMCSAGKHDPNTVLRKLLQAKDDDEFHSFCLECSTVQQSSSVSSSAAADRGADTTQVSPASSTPKPSDQHQLLKQLLNNDVEKQEARPGLLDKLRCKEEEKEVVSTKKSPPAQSPTSSSVNHSRRHSSGGSSTDISNPDSGRGTKRKISASIGSTTISSTSSLLTAEADSTAASQNTQLLEKLLSSKSGENISVTKPKINPQDITATPLQKLQAQIDSQRRTPGKSGQPSNVVDVVNDKIMLGTEQLDISRYAALPRPVSSAVSSSSRGAASMYHPQSFLNASVYDSRLGNQMDATSSAPSQGNATLMSNYSSLGSKDYYGMLGADQLAPALPPQHSQANVRNNHPPMNFQQSLKTEASSMLTVNSVLGGGAPHPTPSSLPPPSSQSLNSNSSLEQLLNMNNDPDGIILELESLLGDSSSTMHLTSPEDELAIRDIENDLLSSIGSLSADASASFTSATNPSRPDSRSPILNMEIPASASNPVQSANINISHRPPQPLQISNSLGTSYSSQSDVVNSHLQQALRGQHPGASASRNARAGHRSRQVSGAGRSLPHSLDGKMRHHSGSSPSPMVPPFSPLSHNIQGNFTLPSNFNEMMKSTEAPPNKKVPQDTTSNPYPHRPPHDLMHMDMSSPRGVRGPQQNFSQSPIDIPCSPQHFRFPDQYPPARVMMSRQQVMRPQQQYADQMSVHQQTMLGSPQGVRTPGGGSSSMDTLPSLPPLPSSQSSLQQYNSSEQWMTNQRVPHNTATSSQYVKREVRAKIAKNLQNSSPQHQQGYVNQPMSMANPSQHLSMMSPPLPPSSVSSHQQPLSSDPFSSFPSVPGMAHEQFEESVLPDDILDQISELTDTQNEIEQKLANSSNAYKASEGMGGLTPEQNMALQKINQSEKESSQVRAQLRALAAPSSQSPGPLVNLFRKQLTAPSPTPSKSKNSNMKSGEPSEKLKQAAQNSNVSVISFNSRPPVEDMMPNDHNGSLLQQLLTEGNVVSQEGTMMSP